MWSSCSPFPTFSLALALCAIHPSCRIIINSHYFPSSVLWLLSVPSRSLAFSEWSFGPGRLRRFSSPSEPLLINRAPHCSSELAGIYQLEWRNALGGSERSYNKCEVRCFMFQEPCVEVTYFLRGEENSQLQHSVNWIKSTRRPTGL